MGYGGKWRERARARELRAESWTVQAIADELGVSKSSVSVWVRDVEFVPRPRNRGHPNQHPHPMAMRRKHQLEQSRAEAAELFPTVSDREFLVFGLALYLGEGFKTEGRGIGMANTSPAVLRIFVAWLRRFFEIDESRLRVRVYLHDHLDLEAATTFWSDTLQVPRTQFTKPYRPTARGEFRRSKHQFGCPSVRYADNLLHRRVMAMVRAISSSFDLPG